MPRKPEWIIYNEDGDFDGLTHGADKDSAMTAAREMGCDGDFYVQRVTPEMRREWRNARRRERYAIRRAEGWRSRSSPVPADFPRPMLGYMAELAVHDEKGRCRCPKCSRFCRIEDFADAPTVMRMAGAIVHYAPACWRCRGLERAPYLEDRC